MAAYRLTSDGTVIRSQDGVEFVPRPHAPEYHEYNEWLIAGGVPDPAPVLQVTPRQARLALHVYGILPQVEAAVNAAGGTTLITWDYATYFYRNDPLINSLGTALDLTSEQIDDLFRFASTL